MSIYTYEHTQGGVVVVDPFLDFIRNIKIFKKINEYNGKLVIPFWGMTKTATKSIEITTSQTTWIETKESSNLDYQM